jgi:hypothetical protein
MRRTQQSQMGKGTTEFTCTTDGSKCQVVRTGPQVAVDGGFRWVSGVLTFEGKGSYNGGDLSVSERWSLSADGKTITIARHLAVSEGETDQTLILEKQ